MSTTNIQPVYDLGTRADYLQFGVGQKKQAHQAAGTDRITPGYYCDAEDIDMFIRWGNHFAEAHKRRVKAHQVLLNFPPDELDVNNPDDLQRAGDLAFHLAKRAFPNSPCLVVVHDDADGGHVHAHITILNHDLVSGRAPTRNRTHAQIKDINDKLMREEGMRVATVGSRDRWSTLRLEKAARIDAGEPKRYEEFTLALGDELAAAKKAALAGDLDQFMDLYTAECQARGIEMVPTEHEVKTDNRKGYSKGDIIHGLQYEMVDEFTPTRWPRNRRSGASKLAHEFTLDGLAADVERERQRRALEAQRQQQATVAQQQRDAMSRAMDAVLPKEEPLDLPTNASFDEIMAAIHARRAKQGAGTPLPAEAEPSPVAAAPVDPTSVATAPAVDGEAVVEDSALAAALADPPSLASAPDEQPARFRSRLWKFPAQTESERAVAHRLALLDEAMVIWREAGLRPDEDVVKKEMIGEKKLAKYGAWMEPGNLQLLTWRHEKLVRANRLYESGDEVGRTRAKVLRTAVAEGRYGPPGKVVPKPLTTAERAQQMMFEPDLEVHHEVGEAPQL